LVFSKGKTFSVHPFKIFYITGHHVFDIRQKRSPDHKKIILQCGVGVSSKNFKKAVDRNRIKRVVKESYRLQRNFLREILAQKNHHLALFLIYTGKELPEFKIISEKIELILLRLAKEIA
jgi:ribonuclease P protein component